MKKRKVSSTRDAAIILLSEGLSGIDDDLLTSFEETLREERRKRSLPSLRSVIPGEGQFSTPASETNLSRSSESPASRTVDETLEIPAAHKELLYKVLYSRTAVRAFFAGGVEKAISEVLARADGRIELLRKTIQTQAYTFSEKFERLLTVRSLALSHEQYRDGKEPVPSFAKTLKLKNPGDAELAVSAIYRGRVWRDLERSIGEPGMSAVMCTEHTLFQKGVRMREIGKFGQYLSLPCFKPILDLAKELKDALEEAQLVFDRSVTDDTRDGINGSNAAAEPDSVSSMDASHSSDATSNQDVPVVQYANVDSRQERHGIVSFSRDANTNCIARSVQSFEPDGTNATPDNYQALDQQTTQSFDGGPIPGNFSQFSEAANFANLGETYPGGIQPANFANFSQVYAEDIEPANFANFSQIYTTVIESAGFPHMDQDVHGFAPNGSSVDRT